MDEVISNNWDLILKYSKDGCFDFNCSGCPFLTKAPRRGDCALIENSGTRSTLEQRVQKACENIVEQRLYEILECK